MAKIYPIQTNFTAGEFSPRLLGRVDIAKYENALKTEENAFSLPHGGVERRGGFHYVAEVKDSTKKTRLYEFSFSVTQNYILEFSDQFLRFYKDNGQIQSGGSTVEIATPFLEAELFELKLSQSADTLFIAHPNHHPQQLTRASHVSWTLASVSFTNKPSNFAAGAGDYPAAVTFFEERLYWAGSTNNPQTIWASKSGDFLNMDQGTGLADESVEFTLAASQVNVIRWLASSPQGLLIGTTGGEFKLTGNNEPVTPTNVQVTPATRYGSSTVSVIEAGRAVLFIQRAGTKLRELAFNLDVDGLVAPDLSILSEHITTGGILDMAYQKEPDTLVWLVRNDGQLISMTYERDQNVIAWARHIVGGHFGDPTITVTDYANIAVGTTITITKSDGTTVVFTSEAISGEAPTGTNGWRPNESNDTTADNLFTAINAHADFTVANPAANIVTIKETIRSGNGLTSLASSDSTRLAVTSESNAVVESVASIPSVDGSRDELWITVKRTIDGSTKRYVEYLDPDVFVDSGLTYSGASTTSFTGLSHLEGETVQIIAGSETSKAVYPNAKVSGGAVSITGSGATAAYIGDSYDTNLLTLPPEVNLTDGGSSFGLTKAWSRILVNVYETIGMEVQGEQITFRSTSDPLNDPPPAFTGIKDTTSLGYDEDDLTISIKQTQGLPLTILNLSGELTINQ